MTWLILHYMEVMIMEKYQKTYLFTLELGKSLCQEKSLQDILKSISEIRADIYEQYGLVIPNVRVKDNRNLSPFEYVIKVSEVEVSRYELKRNCILILDAGNVTQKIKGSEAFEPAYGCSALWISSARKNIAKERGYLLVSYQKIIKTHLTEIIKANLTSVITTQYVSDLFDELMEDNKALCAHIAGKYEYEAYGIVKEILQSLIKDNVSIRNIIPILEVIANEEKVTKKLINSLYEKVRLAISSDIVAPYIKKNTLKVLRISRSFSEYLNDNWKDIGDFNVDKRIVKSFTREMEALSSAFEDRTTIICISPIMYVAKKFMFEICHLKNIDLISDLEVSYALDVFTNIRFEILADVGDGRIFSEEKDLKNETRILQRLRKEM